MRIGLEIPVIAFSETLVLCVRELHWQKKTMAVNIRTEAIDGNCNLK